MRSQQSGYQLTLHPYQESSNQLSKAVSFIACAYEMKNVTRFLYQ